MLQQPATATPVPDSPWLGMDVTDHLGRPATVRRVYDIHGEHVAYLTSALPVAENGEAVYGEHTDLLTAPGHPATVSYQEQFNELLHLEEAARRPGATETDTDRFHAADRALGRYEDAEHDLRQALFDQAQPGDRVYLTGKDWYATVADLDDSPLRDLPRLALPVRLDNAVLDEHPYLAEHYPGGIIRLSVHYMWPTLGLI